MAQLGAKARAGLPASSFAYIDSTGRRLLPIHDEAHVRNALARFNRVEFEDEGARDKARTRLLRAAKRYGIMPVGFIDGELRPESRLPTGRVSLLLADVEDSTGHLTDLGDRYPRLLADARRILRTATRRSGGYVGIAVNTVSRITGMGHGAQILASSAMHELIGETDGIGWRALGRHRLRGIPDEHEIFQVEAGGLPTEFPALRTDPAVRPDIQRAGYRVPHRQPTEPSA
jgi:class 3 adenylate cyclase